MKREKPNNLLQRVSGRLGHGPAPCYKTTQAAALMAGCTVQRMAIPRKGQKKALQLLRSSWARLCNSSEASQWPPGKGQKGTVAAA